MSKNHTKICENASRTGNLRPRRFAPRPLESINQGFDAFDVQVIGPWVEKRREDFYLRVWYQTKTVNYENSSIQPTWLKVSFSKHSDFNWRSKVPYVGLTLSQTTANMKSRAAGGSSRIKISGFLSSFGRGNLAGKKYGWQFRYPANQLRLIVYPIVYNVSKTSKPWLPWDFWTINSINRLKLQNKNLQLYPVHKTCCSPWISWQHKPLWMVLRLYACKPCKPKTKQKWLVFQNDPWSKDFLLSGQSLVLGVSVVTSFNWIKYTHDTFQTEIIFKQFLSQDSCFQVMMSLSQADLQTSIFISGNSST